MSKQATVTVSISEKMDTGLMNAAKKRGISKSRYAAMLLEAAYAASVQETGDMTLDATVAATLLLYGNGMVEGEIALAIGTNVKTVSNIIKAFNRENGNATVRGPEGQLQA